MIASRRSFRKQKWWIACELTVPCVEWRPSEDLVAHLEVHRGLLDLADVERDDALNPPRHRDAVRVLQEYPP